MQTGSAESRSEPTPYAPGSFTYIDGNSIITDTIKARAVDTPNLLATIATIREAFITDAHVVELSAATLKAGTALTGSLTVNGQPLATIKNQAEDPAARINAANTQIDPGKIRISGTTTLSDWRKGGDETRIDGGNISANTVKANALEIGSRNITLTGIQFEHNSPSTNKVSWTAGYIRYIDDTGATVSRSIPAGNATWSSGVMYIYWAKGSNAFTTTSTLSIAMATDNVCIATYEGGTKLDADYGRTIVDGASIKTGTVTATQLVKTAAVLTDSAQIGDGIITNAKIGNIIQSSNFVTGEDGVGWQINKAGSAEFNSVKIRRQLAVQTGTFNVSATTATLLDGKQLTSGPIRYVYTETSVGISAWAGAKRTYLAVAGMVGATATAQSATGAELWGWVAHVAPLTRWSDPQNLRIIFELWAQGITSLSAHQIKWTLYEVS
ncbi:phage tail tip fiber protein [Paracoccus contaminans]|uniref:Tip attachment protein J central straight fiber domain-containing protein n=1 Tax=Paracoccus contaminans TaxID=1945662 RepID=A0A1W6CYZ5_9RHOB|nr:hypothetical protein [Paracoccus contaminans]ARJ70080.1 hypothetical protein B0A89_10990 [Paracoccus contaminans]